MIGKVTQLKFTHIIERYYKLATNYGEKYSYRLVIASYTEEKKALDKKNHIFLYYLYRPLSFPITYACLRLNLTANTVTFFSLLLAISLILLTSSWVSQGQYIASFIVLLYFILDCVDGNIARITNKHSKQGEYFDAVVGIIFWVIVYPVIALQADSEFIEIGFMVSILYLLGRLFSHRAKNFTNKYKALNKDNESHVLVSIAKSFPDLLPILYAVSIYTNHLSSLLTIMLVYYLVAVMYTLYVEFSLMIKYSVD